jgi:uncharacterized protein YdhG (YjbR/CyaY superfamily)
MKERSGTKFSTVDEYMSTLPRPHKAILEELRKTIKKAAPKAEELISYNIPAFRLGGMLVWYAAFTRHTGFYPRTSVLKAFKKELLIFKHGKGSVQFPLDKPLPLSLIAKMVRFRVKENKEEQEKRSKKTKQ